jgi:hypothetical protein
MSFGEEQIIEFEKSVVDIDKKKRKIQELQNACDRTENTVKRIVQQAKLVNARKALAKLVVREQTRRIRQCRDVNAAEEADETTTKTNKGVKRPRTSTKAHRRAQEATKFKKSRLEGGHCLYNTIIVWVNGGLHPVGEDTQWLPSRNYSFSCPRTSRLSFGSENGSSKTAERFHSRNKPLIVP